MKLSDDRNPASDPEISGKWVVLALALFGILMTSAMWIYWKLHLGPFVPLQQAIVAVEEFALSRPVVEGGREKGRAENLNTLRVTMKVEFDPTADDQEVERIERKILDLARDSLPQFDEFELLELNLYQPVQETERKPITIQRHVHLTER
jgi:hypothetical protein